MPNFKVLIPEVEIKKRVKELGQELSKHFGAEEKLVVLGVLRGSFIFLADLVREIPNDCEIDFIELSSYGSGMTSSGKVEISKDLRISIQDRSVLVVEDIVDTGRTLSFLMTYLRRLSPKSVALVTFLDKPSERVEAASPDFTGFKIENHFVVGYGLDFNNHYRQKRDLLIYEP